MKAIVMLLVLASTAFAYTPNDNVQIIKDEEYLGIRIGNIHLLGCIGSQININANGFEIVILSSKWQIRADESDSWADVPDTAIEGVCSLANPTLPGEYRWVANTSQGQIASGNTWVVAGDPKEEEEESQETDESVAEEAEDETAVEAVSWGFLKSRATR